MVDLSAGPKSGLSWLLALLVECNVLSMLAVGSCAHLACMLYGTMVLRGQATAWTSRVGGRRRAKRARGAEASSTYLNCKSIVWRGQGLPYSPPVDAKFDASM